MTHNSYFFLKVVYPEEQWVTPRAESWQPSGTYDGLIILHGLIIGVNSLVWLNLQGKKMIGK